MYKFSPAHLPLSKSLAATILAISISSALAAEPTAAQAHTVVDASSNPNAEKIAPYQARFGRTRPVIAVLGENSGSELTDFMIPFGVLSQSGAAEVVSVSTESGDMKMYPALRIRTQSTIRKFDQQFPQGADYVIVPAMRNENDQALLGWLVAQSKKGSNIVSICNGAIVVANSGLMDGHRATAHWAGEEVRLNSFPKVSWEKNIRYVADGNIISSAGISASIPISIALVEAIAGHDRADTLAKQLGVADWGSKHNSDAFKPHPEDTPIVWSTNEKNSQSIGVPIHDGVDEIALALTAEAYTHTGVSRAYSLAAKNTPIQTLHGLTIIPDRVVGASEALDRTLPAFEHQPSAKALDKALAQIASTYGIKAASRSAQIMEYPMNYD